MKTPERLFQTILMIAVLGVTCAQSNAEDAKPRDYDPEFKSSQYLYEQCKKALSGPAFESSFCAGYIEGYLGGGSANSFYILGQASNQKEISEREARSKCHDLDKRVVQGGRVRWVAEYFVNWIDQNPKIIESASSFLDREAYTVLHTITTDERFCLLPAPG